MEAIFLRLASLAVTGGLVILGILLVRPLLRRAPKRLTCLLWIIAAVLAPIAVVTVIIIIITAVLCRKNKNDFKPDTVMNLPQRAKVGVGSREERGRSPGPGGLCLPFGHSGHGKYLRKPPLQSSC